MLERICWRTVVVSKYVSLVTRYINEDSCAQ